MIYQIKCENCAYAVTLKSKQQLAVKNIFEQALKQHSAQHKENNFSVTRGNIAIQLHQDRFIIVSSILNQDTL